MKLEEMNALTAKGVLSAKVREAIKSNDSNAVATALEGLGFEYVKEKNAFVKARAAQDATVYTILTMTVSTLHPMDAAERKSKPKKAVENVEIEID